MAKKKSEATIGREEVEQGMVAQLQAIHGFTPLKGFGDCVWTSRFAEWQGSAAARNEFDIHFWSIIDDAIDYTGPDPTFKFDKCNGRMIILLG